MSKAFIFFSDGTKKCVEPEKALKAWNMLVGDVEPDETQAQYLIKIKNIFLPPSIQPQSYKEAHRTVLTRQAEEAPGSTKTTVRRSGELTHEGRLQGMYQAVPTGDQ